MANKKAPRRSPVPGKTAAQIAEATMPGWKAVPHEERARAVGSDSGRLPPDATLPSAAELRKKYLGQEATSDARTASEEAARPDDTEVVTMASGPLKRKVGVKGGKIVWHQG